MSRLNLTYAGMSYLDRTIPLETGIVDIPGVALNFVSFTSPGDLFRRQAQHAEFDASEMSLSTFIALVASGDDRFVGVPVFISRNFRHGQIYVHANAGIDHPADLKGHDVGIFEYQMTAGLWIRAFLEHDYGVEPAHLRWWEGGLTEPHHVKRMDVALPSTVVVSRVPPDRTLEEMLETGELAALFAFQPPVSFGALGSAIRRLFPDYRSVELEYFRRTGLFPIMHLVVVRREIYQANRWLPLSLLHAFTAAKDAGMRRLRAITGLAVGLPWLSTSIQELDELFGGDAFPYGLRANRATLGAAVRYSHEQGLSPRLVDVDELFAPETLVDSIAI